MFVLILLYMFVLILQYMCPHTSAYVCPHTRAERRHIGLMSVNSVAMSVNSVATRDAPADVSDLTCSRKSLNRALIEP